MMKIQIKLKREYLPLPLKNNFIYFRGYLSVCIGWFKNNCMLVCLWSAEFKSNAQTLIKFLLMFIFYYFYTIHCVNFPQI